MACVDKAPARAEYKLLSTQEVPVRRGAKGGRMPRTFSHSI